MNKPLLFFLILVIFISCGGDKQTPVNTAQTEENKPDFFPVTNYIKGQIAEIKADGVNPLKITTINSSIDSVWLKVEEFDTAFAQFLTPEIDSANMVKLFKESKFHDQTLSTYTFTYEPQIALPAAFYLKRWDVYINPETNRVKRIYIEKSTADKKDLQLTWQSSGSSKVVYITTDAAGNQKVEKEELIKWNFDEQ